MQIDLDRMQSAARQASSLLKALANDRRLMILCRLIEGEKSVGELSELVGLAQSPLSQHLARLREEGLVSTRREGQTIYYSLEGAAARRVIGLLYEIYCGDREAA